MMKKDLTLLVLAAGMGSRFGGLKQIERVGPNYEIFSRTIGKRIEEKIKVEYVFQSNENVPEGINIPKERIKPLGTAHALYSAKDVINENFAIINADDFYGRDGYMKAAEFLKNCKDNEYAIIGYEVGKTLTDNGSVKRGVIFTKNDNLEKIVESSIEKVNGKIIASPLSNEDDFEIENTHSVSMNLICLTPKIFDYLERNIKEFFNSQNDLMNTEWLLPVVVVNSAKENGMPIKIIKTNSNYYGITYKEDLENLKKGIRKEIELGIYNEDLWG